MSTRRLNKDHNHDLKGLFKAAATRASVQPGLFQDFYQRSLAKGIKPTMARLTLARKIAAITLTLWKKGENFDVAKLKSQAARASPVKTTFQLPRPFSGGGPLVVEMFGYQEE